MTAPNPYPEGTGEHLLYAIFGELPGPVRNGWSIQGTVAVPSETPCRRRNELVLLDDAGDWEAA
jgi:hypothetical protein